MTRMQTRAALLRNATQLDMFAALDAPLADRDQVDIRDVLARPVAPATPATDPAEAARIARVQDWATECAAIAAAMDANPPEVLLWGRKTGPCSGKYLEISLLRDGDRWRVRTDHSMPNMGGGGPFSRAEHATREAALIATLRRQLADIARHLASNINSSVNYGSEADWLDKARWCIEQAPSAMFGGPDLATEFAQLRATYREREALRCAAIRAGAKSYTGEDGAERSIYSL